MKPLPSTPNATVAPLASPAPTRAPVSACVVETGMPRRVATSTVNAAPSAAAPRKAGELATASGTSPLAENALTSPEARTSASIEPPSVVAVAQASAAR
jgi:hypothetical protein